MTPLPDPTPLSRLLDFLGDLEAHVATARDRCATARSVCDQQQARVRLRQEESLRDLQQTLRSETEALAQTQAKALKAQEQERAANEQDLERKARELEATIESRARRQEARSARGLADQQWEAAVTAETAQNRIDQQLRQAQQQHAERDHLLDQIAAAMPRRSAAAGADGPSITEENLDELLAELRERYRFPWKHWLIPPVAVIGRLRAWLRAGRDHALLDRLRAEATELFDQARRRHDQARSTLPPTEAPPSSGAEDAGSVAGSRRRSLDRLESKLGENMTKLAAWHAQQVAALEKRHQRDVAMATARYERAVADLEHNTTHELDQAQETYAQIRAGILMDWNDHQHRDFLATLTTLEDLGRRSPLAWTDPFWTRWRPTDPTGGVASMGVLPFDFREIMDPFTEETGCPWDGPDQAELPLMLGLPHQASLMIEYEPDQRAEALAASRSLVLRLLASIPPGKVELTLVDPVGLGETFSAFMHLADADEGAMLRRIHSESRQIEEQLLHLTDHMQDVIQTYLRNEFETIDDYNRHAGQIAEPYRFLVMADFPVNLSEEAAKRLLSVIRSGSRCGVYAILLRDLRRPFPPDLHERDLHQALPTIRVRDSHWKLQHPDGGDGRRVVQLGGDLPVSTTNTMLHALRDAAESTHRVEVPFRLIKPDEAQVWSGSTADEIRVALGPSGANRSQLLRLGRGTAQHVLVAGKTGSGKSTLMHVLITNLALWCSPDEIEFYLIDFKKGVEFQLYDTSRLPHARVIAIESDREFGLSVLQRIDEELRRRGELFRSLGVQDMAGYRAASDGPLPRTMLIIDEFQEMFTEDDQVTQEASLILDRLVRQGRAFGMHTLLGSQTLDGVYSLARSTMGQMGVRIALQCAEADSYLILSEDNPHARMLSRPGDAIYNDAGGKLEGNSHFQVAWLDDAERQICLEQVAARARADGRTDVPFVFRGHVPATLGNCGPLEQAVDRGITPTETPTVWIGDAVSIEPPVSLTLPRRSGANVLILGQSARSAAGLFEAMLLALATQTAPSEDPSFYLLDGFGETRGRLAEFAGHLPHTVVNVDDVSLDATLGRMLEELNRRLEAPRGPHAPRFMFIGGLQTWRTLRRREDDFSFSAETGPPKADAILSTLLRDGPLVGLHVVTWTDTVNNLSRFLDRSSQSEFENRILFQMSQMDSSQVIDSTAAGRLGAHRALLHREEHGSIQKFRPWATTEVAWLERQALRLRS